MTKEKNSLIAKQIGFSNGGAISSRTAMTDELRTLLTTVPLDADADGYRKAVLDDNILQKSTASNREKTLKFLRSLYALDPGVCLFREMRRLSRFAAEDAPLVFGLLAMAREPLLQACLDMVLRLRIGDSIDRKVFEDWIRAHAPGRYSEAMYVSFSHNLYASFFQFGYLGKSIRKARNRVRPQSGIASATYAAFLDWLLGLNGVAIMQGPYSRALDLPSDEHLALIIAAGRQGLMKVAYSGGVLELGFPGFLNDDEKRPSA